MKIKKLFRSLATFLVALWYELNLYIKILLFSFIFIFIVLFVNVFHFDIRQININQPTNKERYQEIIVYIEQIKISDSFIITQIPDKEYVEDQIGSYYIIDLKRDDNYIFYFSVGEYIMNKKYNKEFMQALDAVKSQIWDKISEKNYSFKIFVEGEADISGDATFSRKFDNEYRYVNIEYHPKRTNSKYGLKIYSKIIVKKNIREPIHNKDLPLLRASFLKTKIEQYPNIDVPELLEGGVNRNYGDQYRNGKIILFIPAPDS